MPAPTAVESDSDDEEADGDDGSAVEKFKKSAEDRLNQLADAGEKAAEDAAGEESVEVEESVEIEGEGEQREAMAEPVSAQTGGLFSGEDDFADDDFDFGDGPGGTMPGMEGDESDAPDAPFEDSINAGFARLAVVGLEDDEKDDLQDEFEDVFEAFRLGHYGSEVMQEYVVGQEDDIDPAWGLFGSLVLCTALVIYQRPDGDEIIEGAQAKISNFRN